jgi:hypothetical protein
LQSVKFFHVRKTQCKIDSSRVSRSLQGDKKGSNSKCPSCCGRVPNGNKCHYTKYNGSINQRQLFAITTGKKNFKSPFSNTSQSYKIHIFPKQFVADSKKLVSFIFKWLASRPKRCSTISFPNRFTFWCLLQPNHELGKRQLHRCFLGTE